MSTWHFTRSNSRRHPASRIGVGRIALGLAAAWFCVHAAIYAVGMCQLDSVLLQASGTCAEALLRLAGGRLPHRGDRRGHEAAVGRGPRARRLSRRSPRWCCWRSRKTPRWLPGSRCCCCGRPARSQGMRQAIARAVGERYATWGVAAAAVYAALVPVCFFLGVLHAITPSIVAVAGGCHRAARGGLLAAAAADRRVLVPTLERGNQRAATGTGSILAWCLLEVIWVDSGGRVHRRQHERSRFRLRAGASCPTCCR